MQQVLFFKSLLLATCLLLPTMARSGESVGDLIKKGDVFDEKFQPTEALKFYLPAEKMEPKNVGLLLRIARQYRHQMADATDPAKKMKLGNMGKAYALCATGLAPNEPEAHLSVAISYAKMSPLLDKKAQLEASKEVKTEVDQTLALDPKKDLAWHLLGCWHQRLADVGTVKRTLARLVYGKVPAATNDEAVSCFQQAIKLNPNRLIHHIELGRTYAQMGKKAEARECIEKGLAMPNVGKDDPDAKERGRATLATIK